ncbi:MAG: c-type cytochrome [Oligoflexia bacterium]|nr:c-type cytochrome [Oligoflexia bacterium]
MSLFVEKLKHCSVAALLVSCAVCVEQAKALPFNTDMYHNQPITGDIMRPKAKDSVPMGSLERRVESKDEAAKLENPSKGDALSTANGERLFAVNCSPCHGQFAGGKQTAVGAVARFMPGPDLTAQLYKDRSDGFFYGTIHFGGMALMPGYGYKLSPQEHWDIVNYIRKFQNGK